MFAASAGDEAVTPQPWKQYSAEQVQELNWGAVIKMKPKTYRLLKGALPLYLLTIRQFTRLTRHDFMMIKGVGRKRFAELECSLAELGLSFSPENEPNLRCPNCRCVVIP